MKMREEHDEAWRSPERERGNFPNEEFFVRKTQGRLAPHNDVMLMMIMVGSVLMMKEKMKEKIMMMMIRMTGKELREEEAGFQQEEAEVLSHTMINFFSNERHVEHPSFKTWFLICKY